MKSDVEKGKRSANASIWILGLLVFGLAALVLSYWLHRRQEAARSSQFRIAQVEHLTGDVWILYSGFDKKRKVNRISPISASESIETDDTGEARVIFDNTAVIRVFPDSMVLIERSEMTDGFQDTLVLQRGDIRVEEPGRTGEFFISKNGTRVAAQDYHKMALATEPIQKPVAIEDPNSTAADGGLSDDEISSLVGAQRGNFMKCFTSLLQKQPDSKGDVSLNFTIENSGKVGLIEVNSVSLRDEEFKKCVISVLSRVEFRAFSGTPISTFFPLKFE